VGSRPQVVIVTESRLFLVVWFREYAERCSLLVRELLRERLGV
jgi:hypothetical protein